MDFNELALSTVVGFTTFGFKGSVTVAPEQRMDQSIVKRISLVDYMCSNKTHSFFIITNALKFVYILYIIIYLMLYLLNDNS